MDGYGNDATSSSDLGLTSIDSVGYTSVPDQSSSDPSGTAAAIAQIFSTGVTAYTDGQAIQRGYQINNPRYFQAGYPGGVGNPYGATPQGASLVPPSVAGNSSLILLLVLGVAAVLLLRKA